MRAHILTRVYCLKEGDMEQHMSEGAIIEYLDGAAWFLTNTAAQFVNSSPVDPRRYVDIDTHALTTFYSQDDDKRMLWRISLKTITLPSTETEGEDLLWWAIEEESTFLRTLFHEGRTLAEIAIAEAHSYFIREPHAGDVNLIAAVDVEATASGADLEFKGFLG